MLLPNNIEKLIFCQQKTLKKMVSFNDIQSELNLYCLHMNIIENCLILTTLATTRIASTRSISWLCLEKITRHH